MTATVIQSVCTNGAFDSPLTLLSHPFASRAALDHCQYTISTVSSCKLRPVFDDFRGVSVVVVVGCVFTACHVGTLFAESSIWTQIRKSPEIKKVMKKKNEGIDQIYKGKKRGENEKKD